MNDELKATGFRFSVQRSGFHVPLARGCLEMAAGWGKLDA
jgi:hypothetical protein